jgi:hypothetical protein
VDIEDVEDLIADLQQALDRLDGVCVIFEGGVEINLCA